jgi:hypothetical protein
MIDRSRRIWVRNAGARLQMASYRLQQTSQALRASHPRRKPRAKIRLICSGCGRGDHQDCSGITFLRAGKNRRQPCGCRCREAKSA